MNGKRIRSILFIAVLLGILSALMVGFTAGSKPASASANTLVDEVRRATAQYKDIKAAQAAGYALFHGCVNGPDHGAMGVHFVNGDLVGDGKVDATKPEALIYEYKDGRYTLAGVEYVVLADDWNKANAMPPVLSGQLFSFTSSPNRYGIPAFYALHVWAWRDNPSGTFADWNNKVSCDQFSGDTSTH